MSTRQHRIITSHALASLIGDPHYPVDPKTIKAAMNPVFEPDHDNPFDAMAWAIAMARTASLFLVGKDARDLAFNGRAQDSGEGLQLPPLPFKRMVLEVHDQEGPLVWGLGSTLIYAPGMADTLHHQGDEVRLAVRVVALMVSEVERGKVWDVGALISRTDSFFLRDEEIRVNGLEDLGSYHVWTYRISEHGVVEPELIDGDDLGAYWQAWVTHHVVNAMHLVTAKGIWHTDAPIHRKQRRRFERETGEKMPPVYWVDMSGPDPVVGGGETGGGSRDWSHKWMVRGHWRRYKAGPSKSGRVYKGGQTWIEAYIKGPDRDKRGRPTTLRRPVHTLVPGVSSQEIET